MNADFVPTVLTKENFIESILQGWNHNRVEVRGIAWPPLLRRLFIRSFNVYGINIGTKWVEPMDTLPFAGFLSTTKVLHGTAWEVPRGRTAWYKILRGKPGRECN
jgi:hypothetical protein